MKDKDNKNINEEIDSVENPELTQTEISDSETTESTESTEKTVITETTVSTETTEKTVNRNAKVRNAAIWSSVILVAILLFANFFLEQAAGNSLKFDWTANQVATLGDTSKSVLDELESDVNITVLATRDNYANGYTAVDLSFVPNLLDEYIQHSGDKLTIRYVDPIQNPVVITDLDPDNLNNLQQGQIVVSNADDSKIRVLEYTDMVDLQYNQQQYQYYITGYTAEDSFTGAIKFVSSTETPVVYLSKGHGETDLSSGYTTFQTFLEQNNFLLNDLDTVTQSAIPEDAEMILMLNPTNDINPNEVDIYSDYLEEGGKLYIMMDYSTNTFPNLNTVLEKFDIQITVDRVKENDTETLVAGDNYTFLASIPTNSIYPTDSYFDYAVTSNARVVSTANNSEDWIITNPILTTSTQATREIAGDAENESPAGALNLAMYAENHGHIDGSTITEPGKVLVFGSASMFSDVYLSVYQNSAGNFPLFVYSMFDMANMADNAEEDLLIQPKPVVSYQILPQSQNSIQIASVLIGIGIPVVLLIAAFVVYRRRVNL